MATNNGGTLYVLQARPPAIIALSPDGSHEVVLANLTRTPDGIKVDAESQMVYWTNMGTGIHLVDDDPASGAVPPNDGTIECAKLDGSGHRVLVPSGMAGTNLRNTARYAVENCDPLQLKTARYFVSSCYCKRWPRIRKLLSVTRRVRGNWRFEKSRLRAVQWILTAGTSG